MKPESDKRFSWIGKWEKVVPIFSIFVVFYIFVFPWFILAALQSAPLEAKFWSSPQWFRALMSILVYPLFFLHESFELYEKYIDWITEVLAP